MKKIIIGEKSERKLFESLINELASDYGNKVDRAVKFLDNNLFRASMDSYEGLQYKKIPIVLANKNGQPDGERRYTLEQLFDELQGNPIFKGMFSDTSERDNFLRQIINDWYYRRITKYGSLSKY